MALGAGRGKVLRLVLAEGGRVVAIGVGCGLLAAFWLTRLLRNQLFEVSPCDPVTLGCAVLIIAGVALLACLSPAIRATRVDPLTALRDQ
jgi:ABC-type antimicrobial peptide transport system permease subunit